MRAAIFSPYLDTLGGGERYVISFAKVLADEGWHVDLESNDEKIMDKLAQRFGLKLSNIRTISDIKKGEGYDLCFWLSDGSIPSLLARKNIIHFQRPFFDVDGRSLINRMKFFRISKVVVNSEFTKKWIDNEFPTNSIILYPPVSVEKFKVKKKENLILNVSRFSQLEQSKRQDILVEVFKKFFDKGNKDWKLILAGGSEVGRSDFVDRLISSAEGYPIKIIENPDFKTLQDLYGRAKIFWSASGYAVDSLKDPQKVEHFGITVVEAMAAGCLPIITNAGGHPEIVKNEISGLLWNKKSELLNTTDRIIHDNKNFKNLVTEAKKTSKNFSYDSFKEKILKEII